MRTAFLCLVPVLLLAAGCAGPAAKTPVSRETYRAVWSVRRAADNTPLASVTSPPVRVGAEENRPAFPEFLARLSPIRRSAQIELVTRVAVLEATRNKKGKLKIRKRFIGGLLPIRPGEKLGVNGPGDPMVVEVELVR